MLLILCSVLAVAAVVFGALATYNFLNPDIHAEIETKAAEYVIGKETKIDALADAIGGVISKDMKEQTSYPEGIRKEFMQAYAVNNNLVGWLTIPGTEIDTALLQSNDNSKYLTKDFYERGTSNTTSTNYGNLYLDYRCITDGLSVNTVIHGHTTGKGDGIPKQAFRSLYDYRNMQTFIENPIIKYSTLYGEYTFKICAVFLSSTQPKDAFKNGISGNGAVYAYQVLAADKQETTYDEKAEQGMLRQSALRSINNFQNDLYRNAKIEDKRYIFY
jgi:SrtB family sortase